MFFMKYETRNYDRAGQPSSVERAARIDGCVSPPVEFHRDCSASLGLRATLPHGHAFAAPSRLNHLIGCRSRPLRVGWFSVWLRSHDAKKKKPGPEVQGRVK